MSLTTDKNYGQVRVKAEIEVFVFHTTNPGLIPDTTYCLLSTAKEPCLEHRE